LGGGGARGGSGAGLGVEDCGGGGVSTIPGTMTRYDKEAAEASGKGR
jgi:hypothetical protein